MSCILDALTLILAGIWDDSQIGVKGKDALFDVGENEETRKQSSTAVGTTWMLESWRI